MLQHLPTELLLKIITSTNVPTLLSLRLVSRAFHAVVQTHERSIALDLPAHAFSSTTVQDFPPRTCSKSGVADMGWLKELERREGMLRELDGYVHRFSWGECDCEHPVGETRHARGLRKLWALSDTCRLAPPPLTTTIAASASATSHNPRTTLLSALPHAHLMELWNTTEILMIELNTAYLSSFSRPPLCAGVTREPWCHIFERGPEWVLRVLRGEDRADWAGAEWRWSVVYGEVVGIYLDGERRAAARAAEEEGEGEEVVVEG